MITVNEARMFYTGLSECQRETIDIETDKLHAKLNYMGNRNYFIIKAIMKYKEQLYSVLDEEKIDKTKYNDKILKNG